jgi:cytidylate kinase
MTASGRTAAKKLIVAIDGPSGAGKSSVTRALADRLGYLHIDTGAMFRVVALQAKRGGINPGDDTALAKLCAGLEIDLRESRVLANGEDVTAAIRSPDVSLLTSTVAAQPSVREYLLVLQRQMGRNGGVVLEGRDIGTVVFPDADVKFYLTASASERGKRRYEELKAKGMNVSLEQTIIDVEQRDEQDSRREHAPLRRADDAVEIDSTTLTPQQVIDLMVSVVQSHE